MNVLRTIGYEGAYIDEFVDTLKEAGVTLLADVRAVAVSRKPGFSKNRLRERLAAEGIDYVHHVELGDPKPGREAARAGKFDLFRSIYGQHLSEARAQEALHRLERSVDGAAVCLLCFERDPLTCHRAIVANTLQDREDVRIEHLFVGGEAVGSGSGQRGTRGRPRESVAAA
nr:DUF488 domain-containing protein [Fulvimarina pelagi]